MRDEGDGEDGGRGGGRGFGRARTRLVSGESVGGRYCGGCGVGWCWVIGE